MNQKIEINEYLEQFNEDIELLNKEMQDTDSLYDKVSSIFFSMVKDPTNMDYRAIPSIHKLIESLTSLKTNKSGLIKERINVKKLAEDIHIKHKNIESRGNEVSGMSEILDYLKNVSVTPDDINASGMEVSNESGMTEEEIELQLLARLDGEEITIVNSENKVEKIQVPENFDIDDLGIKDDIEDIPPSMDIESDDLEPQELIEINSSDDLPEDLYLVVTRFGKVLVINEDFEEVEGYDVSNVKIKLEKNDKDELIAIDVNGDYEIEIVDMD